MFQAGVTDRAGLVRAGSCGAGGSREAGHAGAAFRAASCTTSQVTRLFIILASSHFLFDAAVFHQFTKTPNCILD